MNDIATFSKTKEILDKYHISAKKNYGQNFLIDNNITRNIVLNADINEEVNVLEIGPGIGSLTQELARKAHQVVAVEIDERFKPILKENLSEFTNLEIVYDDFLKLDLTTFIAEHFDDKPIVVVANLPYYITTAILIKIFENNTNHKIIRICAMMQKEVGLRLNAQPNTKDYNSLTILTEYYAQTKIVMKIPKSVFIPAPNVDSVVVLFNLRKPDIQPHNEQLFFKILRILFKQRRKTILNNLNEYFNDKEVTKQILTQANLKTNLRAENLTLLQVIKLSDIIESSEANV